jgi:hypothetical protein
MTDQLINRDENGYDADGNWLECLPWTGQEASLPLGYTVMIPGLDPSQFIKRVEVLDAEEDEGFRSIKKSELKPTDTIVGVELNEKSIKKIVDTYGGDWLRVKGANAGENYNRLEWYNKYGTDAIELLAIKSLRGAQTGTKPPVQNISNEELKPKPPSKPVYNVTDTKPQKPPSKPVYKIG